MVTANCCARRTSEEKKQKSRSCWTGQTDLGPHAHLGYECADRTNVRSSDIFCHRSSLPRELVLGPENDLYRDITLWGRRPEGISGKLYQSPKRVISNLLCLFHVVQWHMIGSQGNTSRTASCGILEKEIRYSMILRKRQSYRMSGDIEGEVSSRIRKETALPRER